MAGWATASTMTAAAPASARRADSATLGSAARIDTAFVGAEAAARGAARVSTGLYVKHTARSQPTQGGSAPCGRPARRRRARAAGQPWSWSAQPFVGRKVDDVGRVRGCTCVPPARAAWRARLHARVTHRGKRGAPERFPRSRSRAAAPVRTGRHRLSAALRVLRSAVATKEARQATHCLVVRRLVSARLRCPRAAAARCDGVLEPLASACALLARLEVLSARLAAAVTHSPASLPPVSQLAHAHARASGPVRLRAAPLSSCPCVVLLPD